ncbi:hypothetical protein [Caulobacter sp. S45]|uniref:hypothetical protein n=1 Tax=Caulobacter sp. S45 TaxID=1641861 RepID=UPI001577282B|nr:hypothetical protein [Caulobacter sp. S45]
MIDIAALRPAFLFPNLVCAIADAFMLYVGHSRLLQNENRDAPVPEVAGNTASGCAANCLSFKAFERLSRSITYRVMMGG